MRSQKITESAKGEDCTFNIPGVCNYDPATTVFCHLKFDLAGVAIKPSDISGAYGCSSCHDVIDGRNHSLDYEEDPSFYKARAMRRTYERLWEKEVISIKGAK